MIFVYGKVLFYWSCILETYPLKKTGSNHYGALLEFFHALCSSRPLFMVRWPVNFLFFKSWSNSPIYSSRYIIRTILVCSFAQLVMATTLLRHITLHLQGYCMIMGNVDGSLVDTNVSHVHIKQAFRQTTQIRIRNQRHWYKATSNGSR